MNDGIRIELSETMKPDAWISFDAKGEITGICSSRTGTRLAPDAEMTVNMVCGRNVYDEMMAMTCERA